MNAGTVSQFFGPKLVICFLCLLLTSCEDREALLAEYSEKQEVIIQDVKAKMAAGNFDAAYSGLFRFRNAVEDEEFQELFVAAEEGKIKAELTRIPMAETSKNLRKYRRLVELRPDEKLYKDKIAFYEAQELRDEEEEIRHEQQQEKDKREKGLKQRLTVEAMSKVKALLRDPGSADFGRIVVVEKIVEGSEIMVACGYVNARNGFGGYTGEQPFISNGLGITLMQDQVSDFSELWNQLCVGGKTLRTR